MAPSLPSATDLARWTLAAQHPLTYQWCRDNESRLARLAEEHEFDLRLATDLDLATQRTTLAPGHDAEALLNRWIAVSAELSAMLSIRFEGGDATKPFVDASALTRPVTDDDLSALSTAAVRFFGSLKPRYVRLWSAAPVDAFAGTRRDKRFMAAPIRDLTDPAHGVAIPPELSLRRTTDLAHYDDAAAAYAAVNADFPRHSEQAALQDADDLQESIDVGTMFDVLIDHTWAGWVAATTESSPTLGLHCYTVQEIILSPALRGHGYGRHLARLLARELPDPDRVLIGTIHADNLGALAAARWAGRQDIGGWLQIPLSLP